MTLPSIDLHRNQCSAGAALSHRPSCIDGGCSVSVLSSVVVNMWQLGTSEVAGAALDLKCSFI